MAVETIIKEVFILQNPVTSDVEIRRALAEALHIRKTKEAEVQR